jgi:hypothetical protein
VAVSSRNWIEGSQVSKARPGAPFDMAGGTSFVISLQGAIALSFVIASEADLSRRAVEGSAVPRTFRGNVFKSAA